MFEIMNWKGTTGEWQHGEDFDNLHEITLGDRSDNIVNVKGLSVTHKPTKEQIFENTRLIVDAGNTIQKCDLLPSELLKQRDELLEALKGVTKLYVDLAECGDCGYWNPHEEEPIANAEELIKKHDQ
jgi:hypothetical protein